MVGHDLVETLEQCLKMAKEARDSNKPQIGDMVYAWDNNPETDGFIYGEFISDNFDNKFRYLISGPSIDGEEYFNNISKTSPI